MVVGRYRQFNQSVLIKLVIAQSVYYLEVAKKLFDDLACLAVLTDYSLRWLV